MRPLLALVAVTAIWGVTFVQVKDALALYPLFAFLAVRFAISTPVLAPFAWRPLRRMSAGGCAPPQSSACCLLSPTACRPQGSS